MANTKKDIKAKGGGVKPPSKPKKKSMITVIELLLDRSKYEGFKVGYYPFGFNANIDRWANEGATFNGIPITRIIEIEESKFEKERKDKD